MAVAPSARESSVLKRIAVADLRVGMYVQEMCGSWMDHPFFRSRFLVDGVDKLSLIRGSRVENVVIDTARGLDLLEPGAMPLAEPEAPPASPCDNCSDKPSCEQRPAAPVVRAAPPRALDEELGKAVQLCQRSREAMTQMFTEARMGQAVCAEQAVALVEDISASVLRHPDAFISLIRLKSADQYTYLHSVAVCALMIAVARQLGLEEAQVREAGVAGLLHDLGKVALPDEILNKPGRLSEAEFAIVRGHPAAGAEILRRGGQVGEAAIDVCLHHHEKIDGSGYPHALAGEDISLMARIGAVCDVYDAISSNRVYKAGWAPAESIRKMAEWRGHFDQRVFQAFVKSVGIYPTGSLVRLHSGRLGVVLEQGAQSLLTPQVKVFFSTRSMTPVVQQVIDLARSDDRILGWEDPAKWGFRNLEELWAGVSLRKGSPF